MNRRKFVSALFSLPFVSPFIETKRPAPQNVNATEVFEWSKEQGDQWGRGPAHVALEDSLTLKKMREALSVLNAQEVPDDVYVYDPGLERQIVKAFFS